MGVHTRGPFCLKQSMRFRLVVFLDWSGILRRFGSNKESHTTTQTRERSDSRLLYCRAQGKAPQRPCHQERRLFGPLGRGWDRDSSERGSLKFGLKSKDSGTFKVPVSQHKRYMDRYVGYFGGPGFCRYTVRGASRRKPGSYQKGTLTSFTEYP